MTTALALRTSDDLLLQVEHFNVPVTSTQRRLLSAEGVKAIGEYTDSHGRYTPARLVEEVGAIVAAVCRDLGIHKGADAYDNTRFLDMLREYFPKMTILDVKQAFEFYVVGELDKYLPSDKEGRPLQHYQQFSASFYVAVLRAYRTKQFDARNDVSGKVSLALEAKNKREEDPAVGRVAMLRTLKDLMVKLAAGETPLMSLAGSAVPALKKLKLLPEAIVPSDHDIADAKARMSRNRDSAVGYALANALKNGMMPDDLQATSRSVCIRRLVTAECRKLGPEPVAQRFDELIAKWESMIRPTQP